MNRAVIGASFLMVLASAAWAADTPPPGYRFPTRSDISGDWAEHANNNPHPFHVRGDFDRNGLVDDAWVMLRTKGDGWAVYVFLKQAGDRTAVQQIMDGDANATSMFLDTASEPGVWKTACGKGNWECAKGEPESVTLWGGELTVTYSESSDFVVLWRPKTKSFQRIQLSD